jgi:hypothetical protein
LLLNCNCAVIPSPPPYYQKQKYPGTPVRQPFFRSYQNKQLSIEYTAQNFLFFAKKGDVAKVRAKHQSYYVFIGISNKTDCLPAEYLAIFICYDNVLAKLFACFPFLLLFNCIVGIQQCSTVQS